MMFFLDIKFLMDSFSFSVFTKLFRCFLASMASNNSTIIQIIAFLYVIFPLTLHMGSFSLIRNHVRCLGIALFVFTLFRVSLTFILQISISSNLEKFGHIFFKYLCVSCSLSSVLLLLQLHLYVNIWYLLSGP